MDLLYSRYSNPLEFMRLYMEQGRFGELVLNIIDAENKRLKDKAEKEDEDKLWQMYIHSHSNKSFTRWKNEVINGQPHDNESTHNHSSLSMTNEQVDAVKNNARNILKGFSPS